MNLCFERFYYIEVNIIHISILILTKTFYYHEVAGVTKLDNLILTNSK